MLKLDIRFKSYSRQSYHFTWEMMSFKLIHCKSLWSLWCTTKYKMQVSFTLHETSPFPFLLKAISMHAISTHDCIMFIIKSSTEHSYVIMSVGWDVKWCPVSRITTTLARKGRLVRAARETLMYSIQSINLNNAFMLYF